jgi:hypothetical protein
MLWLTNPSFEEWVLNKDITEVKEYYNEQKNISAIKEKKKEQTRF